MELWQYLLIASETIVLSDRLDASAFLDGICMFYIELTKRWTLLSLNGSFFIDPSLPRPTQAAFGSANQPFLADISTTDRLAVLGPMLPKVASTLIELPDIL